MAEVPRNIRGHIVEVTALALEAAHEELAEASNVVDTIRQTNETAPIMSIVKGMTSIHVDRQTIFRSCLRQVHDRTG